MNKNFNTVAEQTEKELAGVTGGVNEIPPKSPLWALLLREGGIRAR